MDSLEPVSNINDHQGGMSDPPLSLPPPLFSITRSQYPGIGIPAVGCVSASASKVLILHRQLTALITVGFMRTRL